MLFIAICTFSSGFGISRGLNKDVQDLTQFDSSIWNLNGDNIEDLLGKNNLDDISNYAEYTNYNSEVPYSKFLSKNGIEKGSSYYPVFADSNINTITLSDFNGLLILLGKDTVELGQNEYLAFGDIDDMQAVIQEAIDNNTKININGKELSPSSNKVFNIVAYDSTA